MTDADGQDVDQVVELAAARLWCRPAAATAAAAPCSGPSGPAPFQPLRPPHPSRNGGLCKERGSPARPTRSRREGEWLANPWGSLFCILCPPVPTLHPDDSNKPEARRGWGEMWLGSHFHFSAAWRGSREGRMGRGMFLLSKKWGVMEIVGSDGDVWVGEGRGIESFRS